MNGQASSPTQEKAMTNGSNFTKKLISVFFLKAKISFKNGSSATVCTVVSILEKQLKAGNSKNCNSDVYFQFFSRLVGVSVFYFCQNLAK